MCLLHLVHVHTLSDRYVTVSPVSVLSFRVSVVVVGAPPRQFSRPGCRRCGKEPQEVTSLAIFNNVVTRVGYVLTAAFRFVQANENCSNNDCQQNH